MLDNPKIARIEQKLNTKLPNFRKKQLNHALYSLAVSDFSAISTLPKIMLEALKTEPLLSLKKVFGSKGQQSHKILFETLDGHKIEAVRMSFKPNAQRKNWHHSLCVSSQSGCALACRFCATGAVGFKKNLSAEEIVDQILYFKQNNLPIDSIVFMGMGEPFANPNLFEALKIITDPELMGISPQRLSVSTVGIVPGIKRLTEEFPQINLAFSLHSPFEEERLTLMPITKAYPIQVVMKSLAEYVSKTNNKVFIAYILLGGVNDSLAHAKALAELIHAQGEKAYLYHVNLITFHPGNTLTEYKNPSSETVSKFMKYLTDYSISNTLRQNFGLDIDGACGQLYGTYEKKVILKN